MSSYTYAILGIFSHCAVGEIVLTIYASRISVLKFDTFIFCRFVLNQPFTSKGVISNALV